MQYQHISSYLSAIVHFNPILIKTDKLNKNFLIFKTIANVNGKDIQIHELKF